MKLVAQRVDWLTLAYRVDLDKDVVNVLRARAALAKEHGCAEVDLGPCGGRIKYTRTRGVWNLDNDRYRVHIEERGPGKIELPDGTTEPGWTVEILFSGVSVLGYERPNALVEEGLRIASALGKVYEERLRRIDLCGDVAGWELQPEQAARLVKRPRAAMGNHAGKRNGAFIKAAMTFGKSRSKEDLARLEGAARAMFVEAYKDELCLASDDAEVAIARIHGRRYVTGFSICPGGDLMCRIYNKREELREKEHPKILEELRWNCGGWQKEDPAHHEVTRVEFQIRGEALRDLGLRNPRRPINVKTGEVFASLEAALNSIWRYCLEWARMVEIPQDRIWPTRLTRCPNAPEWQALYAADFGGPMVGVAERRRLRSGATAEQTLGCVLSMLAARGELHYRNEVPPLDVAERLEGQLYADVHAAVTEVAPYIAARILERYGPGKGSAHFAIVSNAARARFLERHAWQESTAAA
jgi:hypothetical protein